MTSMYENLNLESSDGERTISGSDQGDKPPSPGSKLCRAEKRQVYFLGDSEPTVRKTRTDHKKRTTQSHHT